MKSVERRITRWVYPDDDVVQLEPEETLSEIEQAFADLERTFDEAHFDRYHPARATLRSIETHVRDLQAALAIEEAESARLALEAEEMRDSVRKALGAHHE